MSLRWRCVSLAAIFPDKSRRRGLFPARQADLAFSSSGRVQRVYVQLGDYVEEGQVLAQMESAQQGLALLKAQNAYELAKISGTPNALREASLI